MSETAKSKRKGPIRVFAILALVAFVGGVYVLESTLSLFSGSDSIRISKETTWITEPVDEHGQVDYVLAVNQTLSQGVTPDNNAMVDYFRIIGPSGLNQTQQAEVVEWLGEDPFSVNQSIPSLIEEPPYSAFEELPENPWTTDENPELFDWLSENEATLDAVVAASKKPDFYLPLIALDDGARMFSVTLEPIQSLRYLVQGLAVRSLYHVGRGDVAAARQDLDAIHRIALHCGKGPALVSKLVAVYMESEALKCERHLIESGLLSKQELLALAESIRSLPPLCDVRRELTDFERLACLDAVLAMANGRDMSGLSSEGGPPEKTSSVRTRSVDWNIVLEVMNDWFNKIEDVFEPNSPHARRANYAKLEAELIEVENQPLIGYWMFDRTKRSQRRGNLLAAMLLPAMPASIDAVERIEVLRELNLLSASLHAYRLDHESFPERLEDLIPEYVDEVPLDRFQSFRPFVYRLEEGDFLLYSFGQNLQDDGGLDDVTNGDLVIKSQTSDEE